MSVDGSAVSLGSGAFARTVGVRGDDVSVSSPAKAGHARRMLSEVKESRCECEDDDLASGLRGSGGWPPRQRRRGLSRSEKNSSRTSAGVTAPPLLRPTGLAAGSSPSGACVWASQRISATLWKLDEAKLPKVRSAKTDSEISVAC